MQRYWSCEVCVLAWPTDMEGQYVVCALCYFSNHLKYLTVVRLENS